MSINVAGHEMTDGEAEAILAMLKSEAGQAYKRLLENLAEQDRRGIVPRGILERDSDVLRGHIEILDNLLILDNSLADAIESQKQELAEGEKKDA